MITTDADKLEKLFQELEPKRRMQAMRGAFRKAANKVKKQAVSNLRQAGFRTEKSMEKGVRSVVNKRNLGFRVTIGTKKANKKGKGASGWHKNRRGQTLPILIWMEQGTQNRRTKTQTKVFKRKRKGHFTGKIKAYGFMGKTQNEVKDSVTDELQKAIEDSIIKTAQKYAGK